MQKFSSFVNKAILFLCTLASFGFSQAAVDEPLEKSMVIVIPSYNNEDWYQLNLESVLKQNYHNFRVIYINDCSSDRTEELVRAYLEENDPEHKVTFIQNKRRLGALANIYRGVWLCDPSEIIVTVDGDDWLYSEHVLEILNQTYSDPNVWLTYGQYVQYPTGYPGGAEPVPWDVIQNNSFRNHDWVTTHLRTFYAGLFQKIKKEDFLYNDVFFPVAWDLTFMFPMLEMAGDHSRFIPEYLYVYNVQTPLNDNKLHKELQRHLDTVMRGKERYSPIDKPF